jgi:O-6-methylguanine DNA methyltransferase
MGRSRRDGEAMSLAASDVRVQCGRIPILGLVWVELTARGELLRVFLPGLDPRQPAAPKPAAPLEPAIEAALVGYAHGVSGALDALPIGPASSPFAATVRKAMRQIPWGKVATYGELASAIGKPGAARAVGRACATNPLPLVVPCHRVVARAGLGGFGLGLDAKRILLGIEGMNTDELGDVSRAGCEDAAKSG